MNEAERLAEVEATKKEIEKIREAITALAVENERNACERACYIIGGDDAVLCAHAIRERGES